MIWLGFGLWFYPLLHKALLYRIGLSSNTATPLALFGGSFLINLHSGAVRTNRATGLKRGCIWSMTCFPPNRAVGLAILDYRDGKNSVLHTSWLVFSSCIFSVVSRNSKLVKCFTTL